MKHNILQFVSDILSNDKLTPVDKQKIIELAKRDVQAFSLNAETLNDKVVKVEEKIEMIEEKIGIKKESPDIITPEKKLIHIPSKNLYKFLYDFNQDEILKTTCHEIDSNELININRFCETDIYSFEIHRKKIQDQYLNFFFNNKKYFVDHKIKNLIRTYLLGETFSGNKEGWTDEKIKINWNSNDLTEWCSLNPNKLPHPDLGLARNQNNNYGLEFQTAITTNLIKENYRIRYFSELVLYFKHLFHIRSDNSLKKILENTNNSENWNQIIDISFSESQFPENIEFFTNIEKLIQAYKVLINLIIDVANKNNLERPLVELKLIEKDFSVELSIHHVNTIFKKTIQNAIERRGSTFTTLIENQLNGMCEFFIKADFGNKHFRKLNIWNEEKLAAIECGDVKGVEYILEFKK
jgi:hypothetical protein